MKGYKLLVCFLLVLFTSLSSSAFAEEFENSPLIKVRGVYCGENRECVFKYKVKVSEIPSGIYQVGFAIDYGTRGTADLYQTPYNTNGVWEYYMSSPFSFRKNITYKLSAFLTANDNSYYSSKVKRIKFTK